MRMVGEDAKEGETKSHHQDIPRPRASQPQPPILCLEIFHDHVIHFATGKKLYLTETCLVCSAHMGSEPQLHNSAPRQPRREKQSCHQRNFLADNAE
jgi:hypothetical protein